jgi:hypothetical protein
MINGNKRSSSNFEIPCSHKVKIHFNTINPEERMMMKDVDNFSILLVESTQEYARV